MGVTDRQTETGEAKERNKPAVSLIKTLSAKVAKLCGVRCNQPKVFSPEYFMYRKPSSSLYFA
jgi:hypothetical protein